jgi:hypothetical protein
MAGHYMEYWCPRCPRIFIKLVICPVLSDRISMTFEGRNNLLPNAGICTVLSPYGI